MPDSEVGGEGRQKQLSEIVKGKRRKEDTPPVEMEEAGPSAKVSQKMTIMRLNKLMMSSRRNKVDRQLVNDPFHSPVQRGLRMGKCMSGW